MTSDAERVQCIRRKEKKIIASRSGSFAAEHSENALHESNANTTSRRTPSFIPIRHGQVPIPDPFIESDSRHGLQRGRGNFCNLKPTLQIRRVNRNLGEKKCVGSLTNPGELDTRRVRFSSFVTIKIDDNEAQEALLVDEHDTLPAADSYSKPLGPSPSIVARLAGVLSRNFPCMMQKLPGDF